ncbi:MAG: GNAT family N-acyltransferase [Pseudomonadota bacterium]|nr:GNAT family N-acyltransferase [Pseudomonadota bacterium]
MRVIRRALIPRLRTARSERGLPLGGLFFRPRPKRPILARHAGPPRVYARIGNLEVRLARTRGDVKRAQRLRYHVFYEEMSAIPDALAAMSRRDEDPFDAWCDHLLVVDTGAPQKGLRAWRRPRVVGTYRVLRQSMADMQEGFYTQGEYDVAALVERTGQNCRFLELGRSCVLKPYRNRRTVELLWQGVWTYAREHGVGAMFGCASFEGTEPRQHALGLSYLHHYARAPEKWRVEAHGSNAVDMNMIPRERIDPRAAIRALPPLIKGYLKVGARFGDGAVIDHQFGTTDVFVVLPVEEIGQRYFDHFGAPDEIKPVFAADGSRLN